MSFSLQVQQMLEHTEKLHKKKKDFKVMLLLTMKNALHRELKKRKKKKKFKCTKLKHVIKMMQKLNIDFKIKAIPR